MQNNLKDNINLHLCWSSSQLNDLHLKQFSTSFITQLPTYSIESPVYCFTSRYLNPLNGQEDIDTWISIMMCMVVGRPSLEIGIPI